jgi:vacuolar-type H+-ATPase catalytic subunit A/Vma1
MYPQITTKTKDDVLQWLCHNVRPGQIEQIDSDALMTVSNIDFGTVRAIIEDFQEIGLVSGLIKSEEDGLILLILKVKAHDFLRQGGFAVQDALNEANIQKILLELEHHQKQLKPDQMDSINKITAIASSLATVLAAFSDKN